jgi:hypothetical protein
MRRRVASSYVMAATRACGDLLRHFLRGSRLQQRPWTHHQRNAVTVALWHCRGRSCKLTRTHTDKLLPQWRLLRRRRAKNAACVSSRASAEASSIPAPTFFGALQLCAAPSAVLIRSLTWLVRLPLVCCLQLRLHLIVGEAILILSSVSRANHQHSHQLAKSRKTRG